VNGVCRAALGLGAWAACAWAACARPAPADAGAGPERAACEAAVRHVARLVPGEVTGDEADVQDCLRMPRPVVICLLDAGTARQADECVSRYAARARADASE